MRFNLSIKVFLTFSFLFCTQTGSVSQNATVVQEKITVRGKILDENGHPMVAINIIEKGTSNGTSTDFKGNFRLTINKGAKITINYVGLSSKEIEVRTTTINIVLSDDGVLEVGNWEWCCTSHADVRHCDQDIEKLEETHEDDEVYERA